MSEDVVCKVINKKIINDSISPEKYYKRSPKIFINRDLLILILEVENQIRLSYESKEKFDMANENIFTYQIIDTEIRKDALRKFGFNPDMDDSLKALEFACGTYINDYEIREKVVWMKYDKTSMGNFNIGDPIYKGNIYIYDLNHNMYILNDLLKNDRPNIIVCGSMS